MNQRQSKLYRQYPIGGSLFVALSFGFKNLLGLLLSSTGTFYHLCCYLCFWPIVRNIVPSVWPLWLWF